MGSLFAATIQPGVSQYYIGWGTLSLINAGLARSKGHSGMAWWVVSLLLGPVATFMIVAFLQPPSTPTGSWSTPSQGRPDKPPADRDVYDDLA